MKLGIATNKESASKPQWITFDMKGYEANIHEPEEKQIRFLVRPQTRNLVTSLEKRAEMAAKARGREYAKGGAELPSDGGDKGDRFTREMAKELVVDWAGVCDLDGNPLECNDTNKIWLFENIDIAVWVLDAAKELAAVRIEEEGKN